MDAKLECSSHAVGPRLAPHSPAPVQYGHSAPEGQPGELKGRPWGWCHHGHHCCAAYKIGQRFASRNCRRAEFTLQCSSPIRPGEEKHSPFCKTLISRVDNAFFFFFFSFLGIGYQKTRETRKRAILNFQLIKLFLHLKLKKVFLLIKPSDPSLWDLRKEHQVASLSRAGILESGEEGAPWSSQF